MKPTPLARPLWPLAASLLALASLLGWGCGHSRQILYPDRKVSPPQSPRAKIRLFGPKVKPTAPPSAVITVPPRAGRQPDAPAAIDVPLLDQE